MSLRTRVIIETVVIFLLVLVLVGAIIMFANKLDYRLGPGPVRTEVIAVITIFAFSAGIFLFLGIVALGLTNYHKGAGFSALFPSILMFVVTLFAWLSLTSVSAYDIISNDGVPTPTHVIRQPEIAIASIVLVLCFVVVAPSWFLASALRQVGWSRLEVTMLFMLMGIITAMVYFQATALN